MNAATLTGPAQAAADQLAGVLEQYRDARPAALEEAARASAAASKKTGKSQTQKARLKDDSRMQWANRPQCLVIFMAAGLADA